jgi:surface carbohydrate biosynthesis protein
MSVLTTVRKTLPKAVTRSLYRRQALGYIERLTPEYRPDRKTILIINHYFDQDIRALQAANGDYNLVVVDGPRLFKGGKIYFHDNVMRLAAPYIGETEQHRRRFRRECEIIYDALQERFPFHLVVSAADNFWWVREFITVARRRGIQTVVLDKEGTRTPQAFATETHRIRDFAPFISDHIFVWSQRQRRFWNAVGVADNDITVVGQPRSDLFYREHRRDVDALFRRPQALVTMFSYEDTAYIPPGRVKRDGSSWMAMKNETHEFFAEMAAAHPERNFVIKTHPQQSDLRQLTEKYRRDNVAVVGGSSTANELLQCSELIIAFQTTAVLEAMFLDRPVIYTAWDPQYRSLQAFCLPLHEAPGIVVADRFDRFRDVCRRFLAGDRRDFQFSDEVRAARARFVDEYFYQPDGHVCERFFAAVGRFVS